MTDNTEYVDDNNLRWKLMSKSKKACWIRSQYTGKLQSIPCEAIENGKIKTPLSHDLEIHQRNLKIRFTFK